MPIYPSYKMVVKNITKLSLSGPIKVDEDGCWMIGGSRVDDWLERLEGCMVDGELRVRDNLPDDTELVASGQGELED